MKHDAIAQAFDAWVERGDADRMEALHADVFQQVFAELALQPGEKVLDLGCGNGWTTRLLAKAAPGVQAIGVDASTRMVARAEELHSYTIRARYECAAFEALDFPAGHFERAFSLAALYFSPEPRRALAELARVLKPKGRADVVIDGSAEAEASARWAERERVPLVRWSAREWQAAFEQAGFASVDVRRLVDRRGPGSPDAFQPDARFATFEEHAAACAQGWLWLCARRS